ncbi:TonB-dependent receptor plug domain-containing protein [Novosphingobium sp. Gsoil 351]|nr:TonB-dependent receptor plug domain-containing protein [Novosphingobium sp. Gsoil 351]
MAGVDQFAQLRQHAGDERVDRRPLLIIEIGDLAEHRFLDRGLIKATGDERLNAIKHGSRRLRSRRKVAGQRFARAPVALKDEILPIVRVVVHRGPRQPERRRDVEQRGLGNPRALSWRAASSSSKSRRLRLAARPDGNAIGVIVDWLIWLLGRKTYAYVKSLDKPNSTCRYANILICKTGATSTGTSQPGLGRKKMLKATRIRSGLTLAFLSATAVPTCALGQASTTAADDGSSGVSGEIVVTAQRREQQLTDVGISIAALSERSIQEARISQIENIAAAVPNVDIKEQVPGALPVVTIRGIGLDDFSSTNSPSAGVYVDEVPLASIALMSSEIYDLERIEVLKGPQGTLYGRNSTAGAVNILTARPDDSFSARASAGYGNFNAFEAEGFVNVPLSDTLAARVSARTVQQGKGYWTSRRLPGETLGERNILTGRAQLSWRPDDALAVTLKVEGLRSRSEMGQGEFFGTVNPLTGGPCAPVLAGRVDNSQCTDFFGYTDTDGDPFRATGRATRSTTSTAGTRRLRSRPILARSNCARSPGTAGRTAASTSIPTPHPRARSISSRTTKSGSSRRNCTCSASSASRTG